MTKETLTFKRIYLIYLGLLTALVLAALAYVYFLLREYEAAQPERQVWQAVEELSAQAADGTFWDRYGLPRPSAGIYERDMDLEEEYLALFGDREALTLVRSEGSPQGDVLTYQVECRGVPLAQVSLRAEGEPVTKLAVFTMRRWAVDGVRPQLEPRSYTLTVPDAFAVSLNGRPLTGETGENGETAYAVSGLYLPPDFSITDGTGTQARYTIRDGEVRAEYFHYTLTLPSALTVQVNGAPWPGQAQGEDRVRYEIALLEEPEVTITDGYGGSVDYRGGDALPLTSCTITASEGYTVLVDGQEVPPEAVASMDNPDYQAFADYVEDLPALRVYSVAVLREGAEITVTDERGEPVPLEAGADAYDLTQPRGESQVPPEVSEQVDVLQVAQDWSLFMTNDLPFSRIQDRLIPGSYQYEVALKYATGVDITFTSQHTLASPAFTDSAVTNFTWITDDCFSVDIRFVKHMRLWYGELVDDPMNDRFYFVRYGGQAEGGDAPTWKLAGMKEILNDGDQ